MGIPRLILVCYLSAFFTLVPGLSSACNRDALKKSAGDISRKDTYGFSPLRKASENSNYRGLNKTDIENILSNRAIVGRGSRGGERVLADYVSTNADSLFIASSSVPPREYQTAAASSEDNAITFDTKLIKGNYYDEAAVESALKKHVTSERLRTFGKQVRHTAVEGSIPIEAIQQLNLNGRTYKGVEIQALLNRIEIYSDAYVVNENVIFISTSGNTRTIPIKDLNHFPNLSFKSAFGLLDGVPINSIWIDPEGGNNRSPSILFAK